MSGNRSYTLKLILLVAVCGLGISMSMTSSMAAPWQSDMGTFSDNQKGYPGVWGVCFRDGKSGEILYAHGADTPLIPASNQKVVVAVAAMHQWDVSHRQATPVLAHGKVSPDGTLQGDLVVQANGALVFTGRYPKERYFSQRQAHMRNIAKELVAAFHKAGIKRVAGTLRIDEGPWAKGMPNRHYPSAVGVLFNENTVDVEVYKGKLYTVPAKPEPMRIFTNLKKGTQIRAIVKKKATDDIRVNPKVASRDYWRFEAHDVRDFYRRQVMQALSESGLPFDGKPNLVAKDTPTQALTQWPGISLGDWIGPMNIYSDNLRAEVLLLNVAQAVSGEATYGQAHDAVARIMKKANFPMTGIQVADGSGLSRDNRISASVLSDWLVRMQGHAHSDLFRDSLPQPGAGTLRRRLLHNDLKGRIWAKTGSLRDVSACSGYLKGYDGKVYAFSLLNNKSQAKGQIWAQFQAILLKALERTR